MPTQIKHRLLLIKAGVIGCAMTFSVSVCLLALCISQLENQVVTGILAAFLITTTCLALVGVSILEQKVYDEPGKESVE